jgi:hypothetical protein
MPGPLAHIRQVHRGDPAGHLAHAPQVLPLDAGRGSALLDLTGLIDRPDPQAPPAARAAGRLVQPGHREPAHHPHRREAVPDRAAEQPLSPLRRPVPGLLRNRPPVPPGQVTGYSSHILTCLPPRLHPRKARPQQPQQLTTLPGRQRGPYPGSRSRLRFCRSHEHMIGRRLRPVDPAASLCPAAGQTPNGDCRTRQILGVRDRPAASRRTTGNAGESAWFPPAAAFSRARCAAGLG